MPKGVYVRTAEHREKNAAGHRMQLDPSWLRARYGAGATMKEMALELGISVKPIFNALHRLGVPIRPGTVRDNRGPKNPAWKGDRALYSAMHLRVATVRGKPQLCEDCGTTDPSRKFEWANMTGRYDAVEDYRRLCGKCHILRDQPGKRGQGRPRRPVWRCEAWDASRQPLASRSSRKLP